MFAATLSPAEVKAGEAMTAVAVARKQSVINAPAYAAKGSALAHLLIAEVRGQGSIYGRYYRDLLALEAEGRKAFRSALVEHSKQVKAYVPGTGKERDPVMKSTAGSAVTRLSEFTRITQALDAGLDMDAGWPFHYAVGQAREFMRSQGAADGRGRKAATWQEKLAKYIKSNVPAEELDQVPEAVAAMIAAVE